MNTHPAGSRMSLPCDSRFQYAVRFRVHAFLLAVMVIVFLVLPCAGRGATLDDFIRDLTQKIASTVNAPFTASIDVQNRSSLAPAAFSGIEQAVRSDLAGLGVRASTEADAAALKITLSENVQGFVWTAEIRQADRNQIVILNVPQSPEDRIIPGSPRMFLHSELIWQGPDPVLDIAFATLSNYERRMVLLLPHGLLITKMEGNAPATRIDFTGSEMEPRDPMGNVRQVGRSIEAILGPRDCRVVLDTNTFQGCDRLPERVDENLAKTGDAPRGDQSRQLASSCGIQAPLLRTASGDYTQPDSVRVFDGEHAVSNELAFPGPVLAFAAGTDSEFSTAIVHNLQSGNYEAYRLSISCAP